MRGPVWYHAPSMAAKRLSLLIFGAIALIAASAAWLTGGALTLTSFQPNAVRIGLLPSPWWLVAWLGAAVVILAVSGPARRQRFALSLLAGVLILPWLPRAPAAFHIWIGPLRCWLWATVLLALLVPVLVRRTPPWLREAVRNPRRAPWLAAAVAAAAYGAGACQVFPRLPTGDEPHYLVIAQSLLEDHDLRIENNHRRGDYHQYYAGDLRPDYLRRGVNGEIYSVHAPGLAVLVAPALAMFGYPGVLTCLVLVSAWAAGLAWIATWRVTFDVAASWFGWAAAALSAPFFFQSFVVYPDAPGAALVMVGVLALVDTRPISTKRLVLTGLALAMLPWLHTRYVAAAAMLGALIAARLLSDLTVSGRLVSKRLLARQLAALLSIPVVSALCWFGFFYAIYGSPDPRGPYGGNTQSSVANLGRGIVGLLFDQQFGVLPAAPVLCCALAGLFVLAKRSLRLAATLVLVAAPYGLVVSAYQMWWGGSSSPGRFLIPVMLPLAIPAGVWFQTRRGHTGRLLGFGALTVSLLITTTLAAVDRGLLLYNFRDGSSRLLTWLSPLVNITTGLPSVFQTSPSSALLHGLVWIGAIALTAAAGILAERRGAARTTVALVLGFAATVTSSAALSVVWWDHGVSTAGVPGSSSAFTPAAATVAFLQRLDPDGHQLVARYSPIRRVRARDVLGNLTLADTSVNPPSPDGAAVALFRMPAATYGIEAIGSGTGPLTVTVDGELGPQWAWTLDASADPSHQQFRLPALVKTLLIKAPPARTLLVRPIDVPGSSERITRRASDQAARHGPGVVFLLGGHAFMELGGTWVEGGRSADFAVGADTNAPIHLLVRNPQVSNVVTLEGENWREYLILAPGEERLVALPFPPASGSLFVRVTSRHGARPSEYERGSLDTRFLGCWIETRP